MRTREVVLPEQHVHFVVSKVTIRQDGYKFAILLSTASGIQPSETKSDITIMTPFRFFATTIVLLSLTSGANAQTGGTGGTGGFGTGTTGGTTGGFGTTSGTGGTTGGTGLTSGTGGTTGTGSASGAMGGPTAAGGTATNVSTLGSNAAQSFIGANATQGFIGGAAGNSNQQRSNRQFQALQNNNQQQTQQATGTPRAIKTTLRVGFAFPSAPQLIIAGRIANANVASMERFVPRRPELNGIDVDLYPNGLAVLTGAVPNEETRRLAANLMRLQPGVRKIENQLVVQAE